MGRLHCPDMDLDAFVLAAATADLDDEPAARAHADAVEFRMDLATGDPLAALDAYDGQLPIIATNRITTEGGEAPDTPERLEVLVEAAAHPHVEAVDIELSAVEDGNGTEAVEAAREAGASTVVSAHDFEGTPEAGAVGDLLARGATVGDVAKVATTADDAGDVLTLLSATWDRTRAGDRVATMAMGEAGRHSRVVAPLYGSRIGYAPVDPDRATAPGQYDLATMRSLIDSLRPVTGMPKAQG